jgi:hypothetical protein
MDRAADTQLASQNTTMVQFAQRDQALSEMEAAMKSAKLLIGEVREGVTRMEERAVVTDKAVEEFQQMGAVMMLMNAKLDHLLTGSGQHPQAPPQGDPRYTGQNG